MTYWAMSEVIFTKWGNVVISIEVRYKKIAVELPKKAAFPYLSKVWFRRSL